MIRRVNPILAIAALVTAATCVFGYVLSRSVPAQVTNAALLARTPSLTRAARVVAEAISTPPEPVPSWLAFLHPWQSLLGGILALVAALVGAWALTRQAETGREAIREQIGADRTVERERAARERRGQRRRARERKRTFEASLSSELRSWHNRIGDASWLAILKARREAARHEGTTTMPVFPVFDASFPIYDSVCGDIGILDPRTAISVVQAYAALRGLLDAFRGVRDGDYDFLKEPNDGRTAALVVMSAGAKAARVAAGLDIMISDLKGFDRLARLAIAGLDERRGVALPELPEWCSPPS